MQLSDRSRFNIARILASQAWCLASLHEGYRCQPGTETIRDGCLLTGVKRLRQSVSSCRALESSGLLPTSPLPSVLLGYLVSRTPHSGPRNPCRSRFSASLRVERVEDEAHYEVEHYKVYGNIFEFAPCFRRLRPPDPERHEAKHHARCNDQILEPHWPVPERRHTRIILWGAIRISSGPTEVDEPACPECSPLHRILSAIRTEYLTAQRSVPTNLPCRVVQLGPRN